MSAAQLCLMGLVLMAAAAPLIKFITFITAWSAGPSMADCSRCPSRAFICTNGGRGLRLVCALDCEHHVCFTQMHRSQVTCQGRSHVSYLKATLPFRAGRNVSLQHWLWQGASNNVYQIHLCSLALVKGGIVVLDWGFGQWTLFTDWAFPQLLTL